jgi:membrane protease YdiL (CAAX protease family)
MMYAAMEFKGDYVDSAICALGHLDNAKAIPLVLRYQDHLDENIRFAVTFALGCSALRSWAWIKTRRSGLPKITKPQ